LKLSGLIIEQIEITFCPHNFSAHKPGGRETTNFPKGNGICCYTKPESRMNSNVERFAAEKLHVCVMSSTACKVGRFCWLLLLLTWLVFFLSCRAQLPCARIRMHVTAYVRSLILIFTVSQHSNAQAVARVQNLLC
jgi:hypothetical protein